MPPGHPWRCWPGCDSRRTSNRLRQFWHGQNEVCIPQQSHGAGPRPPCHRRHTPRLGHWAAAAGADPTARSPTAPLAYGRSGAQCLAHLTIPLDASTASPQPSPGETRRTEHRNREYRLLRHRPLRGRGERPSILPGSPCAHRALALRLRSPTASGIKATGGAAGSRRDTHQRVRARLCQIVKGQFDRCLHYPMARRTTNRRRAEKEGEPPCDATCDSCWR